MSHANLLLDRLPATELRHLLAQGVHVSLQGGQQLAEQDTPARALLFPMQGFCALLTPLQARPPLQVGMVGREGVLGSHLLLGVAASPAGVLVLDAGSALGLGAPSLRRLLPTSPGLRRLLMRYLHVQLRQSATAVACMQAHGLRPRLARWLLMGRDRAQGDSFAVTHETLAQLLGVRREGVTVAAGELQAAGLIHYHRGWVTIGERAGLEALACTCYGQDGASYRQGMNFPAWPAQATPLGTTH